jgi:hypothetical protein
MKTSTLKEKSIFAIAKKRIFVATAATFDLEAKYNVQGEEEVRQCIFIVIYIRSSKKPSPYSCLQ